MPTYPSGLTPSTPPGGKVVGLFDDFVSGGPDVPSAWTGHYSGTPGGTNGKFLASHITFPSSIMQLEMYQDAAAADPTDLNWAGAGIQTVTRWPVGSWFEVALRIDGHLSVVAIALLMGATWPPEIDFFEATGLSNGTTASAHYLAGNSQVQDSTPGTINNSLWHVWGVRWEASTITYTIDGTVWASRANPSVNDVGDAFGLLSNQFLSLQVQDGDPSYPANDPSVTALNPVKMQVDWVNIFIPGSGGSGLLTTTPTAASVTETNSPTFSQTLATTGGTGPVTYVQGLSGQSANLVFTPSTGRITTTGRLVVGTYAVSGTTSDTSGNAGTWNFTLTVIPSTIVQAAPTSGTTTTTGSTSFTAQLQPTTFSGLTTVFTTTSSNANLHASSSGAVTTSGGPLAVGTRTISGTTSDGFGDTGTWTYTLTVTAATITQTAPFSGTTTSAGSTGFTHQLTVTGNNGAVTYTTTSSNPNLHASSTGAITTSGGPLSSGTYTISGTTSDPLGDTGTWTYGLIVTTPGTIAQAAPTTGTVTTTGSTSFTSQLEPTTNAGFTVTFTTVSSNANVHASSSGAITTTGGPLATGTYTLSGTTSDTNGDTGSWTYTLTVTAATITQVSPFSNTVTVAGSTGFTSQLNVTGNNGTVTYTTVSSNANVHASSSGAITVTGAPLSAGTYTISGTTSDPLGDTGTWTYELSVSTPGVIVQTAPLSGTTITTGSTGFTAQLQPTTSTSHTVTYTTTAFNAHLVASSSGVITTVSGPLSVGTYTISGTTDDGFGDTGTWTYTLTVTPATIVQGSPLTDTTTQAGSTSFVTQLNVTGNYGTVTYTTTASNTNVHASSSGAITTTGGPLATGTYTISGTTSDPAGDTGTWFYSLTVTAPGLITQIAPLSNSTTTSAGFIDQLQTRGNIGAVAFVQTAGASAIRVSSSGVVTTTSILPVGNYTASGTDSDTHGNVGTWTYTLTVTGSGGSGGGVLPPTVTSSGLLGWMGV